MSTSSCTSVKQMGYRYVAGCYCKLDKPLDNRKLTVRAGPCWKKSSAGGLKRFHTGRPPGMCPENSGLVLEVDHIMPFFVLFTGRWSRLLSSSLSSSLLPQVLYLQRSDHKWTVLGLWTLRGGFIWKKN